MKDYKVYVHIFPNGKRYYGATKQDPKQRWKKDGKGYKNNDIFWHDVSEYGWNNIQHITVARGLSEEDAHWLEIELIRIWDTTNPDKGYNIAFGIYPSEDTKKKLSEAKIGENNPMYGKPRSEETKKKISKANRGKNNVTSKPVICLTTKTVFYTASDGAKYYNCDNSAIIKCCKGKVKSAGKYNGQKLVWRYLYLETL